MPAYKFLSNTNWFVHKKSMKRSHRSVTIFLGNGSAKSHVQFVGFAFDIKCDKLLSFHSHLLGSFRSKLLFDKLIKPRFREEREQAAYFNYEIHNVKSCPFLICDRVNGNCSTNLFFQSVFVRNDIIQYANILKPKFQKITHWISLSFQNMLNKSSF